LNTSVTMVHQCRTEPFFRAHKAISSASKASSASSTLTRELLGWHPTHPELIDDLDKGHYFHNPSA
jgi:hypothetical protein